VLFALVYGHFAWRKTKLRQRANRKVRFLDFLPFSKDTINTKTEGNLHLNTMYRSVNNLDG